MIKGENKTPIELEKREGGGFWLRCVTDDFEEFLDFTALLGEVKEKAFDRRKLSWYCSETEAKKINDKLNNQDIGNNMKLKPYGYQRQAIAYCLEHKCGLICLPCGAGKTPIGLGTFLSFKEKSDKKLTGMFIVKASLKSQWLSEVGKFTDLNATILQTFKASTTKYSTKIRKLEKERSALILESALEHAEKINELTNNIAKAEKEQKEFFAALFDVKKYDIFIANYETLTDPEVKKQLLKIKPQFWYIDEIDAIKSPTAKRSKAIYIFNNAKYRFGATATPIRKNPKDLFGIFSFINPNLFPKEHAFDARYLKFWNGRISGSKNEEELAEIVSHYIFKRSYEDIADQLPKQTVCQIACNLTDKQLKVNKRLTLEIDDYKEQLEILTTRFSPQELENNAEKKQLDANIVARQTFMQMLADDEELLEMSNSNMAKQYVTGSKSNKLEICLAIIQKIVDSGQKVCVFSKYIGIQNILEREINKSMKDVAVSRIEGSMSDAQRYEVLQEYKKPNHNVLLASDAAEAGVNLSNTRYLIEFELADSAAKQTQRHGRIQRADSIHDKVFVYQLIAKGTEEYPSWDEIALKIVNKKQGYSDRIL